MTQNQVPGFTIGGMPSFEECDVHYPSRVAIHKPRIEVWRVLGNGFRLAELSARSCNWISQSE